MTPVERLEQLAQQLAAGVRYDAPEANARWLRAELPDPQDWFRLCFVLAAAVPDDETWAQLTSWWTGYDGRKLLRPHGTPAAVARHRYNKQPLCEACREWDRDRKRHKRREHHDDVATRGEDAA